MDCWASSATRIPSRAFRNRRPIGFTSSSSEIERRLEKQPALEGLLGLGPAHRAVARSEFVWRRVRRHPGCWSSVRRARAKPPGCSGHPSGTGPAGTSRSCPSTARHCPPEILGTRAVRAADKSAGSSAETESQPGRANGGRPRLSLSDGKTLLIREIFLLPRDLQARLAASLESQVRLIGTTVLEPEDAFRQERVRPELYFALTTLVVRLRPLRDRRDDLPVLAQHLLERANQRGGRQRLGFLPEAIAALLSYDWPGNIHELTRVVDHAHAFGAGDQSWVTVEDLPSSIRGNLAGAYLPPIAPSPIKPLDQLLTEVEQRSIETALRQARGNKSRAADLLGISRPRLYRRIKELNLPDEGEAFRKMRRRIFDQRMGRVRAQEVEKDVRRQRFERAWESRKSPFTSLLRGLSAFPFFSLVCQTLTIQKHPGNEYNYSLCLGRTPPGGRISEAAPQARRRGRVAIARQRDLSGVKAGLFRLFRLRLPHLGRAIERCVGRPGPMRPAAPRGTATWPATAGPRHLLRDRRAKRGPSASARPRRHATSGILGTARYQPAG